MNRWRWTRALLGYAIAIAAILGQRYTPYVFTTVSGDPLYLTTLVPGPLYPYYILALFIFISLSLVNLVRSARAASTLQKKRQLYLMIAATFVAGLIAPIGFVSYWLTAPLPRVLHSSLMILAILLLGYGITRYNALVEGRVIPRDFLYNGVVILLVAGLYLAVIWSTAVSYEVPSAAFSILVVLAIITHSFVDVGRHLTCSSTIARPASCAPASASLPAVPMGPMPWRKRSPPGWRRCACLCMPRMD
jgi:hypothetical protein